MCGIAGIFSLDGQPVERTALDRMIGALLHRGPDGRGMHLDGPIGLGHTRLSILDPTPAGAQPMLRGRNALVHNGEVYNYLELAHELETLGHHIQSQTDTEVILAAYRQWGMDAVQRLNGMFAFALWDAEMRRLILARDRMGVKPLYIRRTSRSIAFASEPRALLAARPMDETDTSGMEPHAGAVRDFLAQGLTDHSSQTFFEGITSVPPGHVMVIDGDAQSTSRYWSIPLLGTDDRPVVQGHDRIRDQELVEQFRACFDSAVRLRLRSDVPIGSCLSGGLDSSSIVATVAQLLEPGASARDHEQIPRLAFHARFPADGIDESGHAEAVAAISHVRLVHRTPSGRPLLGAILPVLRAQGEPYGGASINAQYAVMAAAHEEGLKVLLDGQGADELLGGYLQFLGVRTAGLLTSWAPRAALAELRGQVSQGTMSAGSALLSATRVSVPRAALESVRGSSGGRLGIRLGPTLAAADTLVDAAPLEGTLLARRLWRATASESLPALLRYEDRSSMAFGVEARVPFLDVRLVELSAGLPDRLRINRGVTKVILRSAMRDRVPESIRDRRDKLGFVAPQRSWLTAARPEVTALLRDGKVVERGWVRSSDMERLLSVGFEGRRSTDQLWRILVTEAWLRLTWPGGAQGGGPVWEAALEAESDAAASRPR